MNIGLIYFKKEENDFKFLLGKKNLKTLNLDNILYSDLGGYFEEDNLDDVKYLFKEHTFDLVSFKDDDNNFDDGDDVAEEGHDDDGENDDDGNDDDH